LALLVEDHKVIVGASLGADMKRPNGHQVDGVFARLSDGIQRDFVIMQAAGPLLLFVPL